MNKCYIVLWKRNARLASVELTNDNYNYLAERFYLSLIQKDITGTLHFEVLGIKAKRRV